MTVCYFGDYRPNYARNRVLIRGLRANGVKVLECRSELSGWGLVCDLRKKHTALKGKYDILVVGQSDNRRLVWLAKLLSRKKIIWDAFYSIYEALVFDKKLIRKNSPKALWWWLIEWLACCLADGILLDTNQHIEYFVQEFGVSKDKFKKILVGSDVLSVSIASKTKDPDKFLVHFHGKYIPLQGAGYIIKAAKFLEEYKDIQFNMIGRGQMYLAARKLAEQLQIKNINFIDQVPYDVLAAYMSQADLCLGIFGHTDKAQRVIPNKVYEAIALGKPTISADTPAIRELFTNRANILLCRVAEAKDLAAKILLLKNNALLRKKIARQGAQLFQAKATPKILGEELLGYLKKFIKKNEN